MYLLLMSGAENSFLVYFEYVTLRRVEEAISVSRSVGRSMGSSLLMVSKPVFPF
jgi:hypothetical protein